MNKPKVFVLGIDSAAPWQVFDLWLKELPTLKSLVEEGAWGRIASTVPPITCPAWPSAFTGMNPGHFGLYDLRYRRLGKRYFDFHIVNSRLIKYKRVWDYLSEAGYKVITAFVPVTYPPSKVNGCQIASFLTPTTKSEFTYPPELKNEIFSVIGGEEKYIIDVYGYRQMNPRELYQRLREKTDHDFKIIKHLLKKEWDLFVTVIMSIDRAQHTLWRFFDKEHPRYEEDPELKDGLLNLYKQIDDHLADIISQLPEDTTIIVLSDHGAKRMFSRINVNELFIQEGLLKLNKKPKHPTSLAKLEEQGLINWKETKAFALGAYIAQVFINLKGREPKGIVNPGEEYEDLRKQIADILKEVRGEDGRKLNTIVYMKEDVYCGEKIDIMPDLTAYFDNLHYGANEAIGYDSIYSLATLKGPDDSNHGEWGIFIMRNENVKKGEVKGVKLEDITPTILDIFGVKPNIKFDGKSLLS